MRNSSDSHSPILSASDEDADLHTRVQAEFQEMPGLKLTELQIRRLWCLDTALCDAVIASLMAGRFLRRTHANAYVRFDGGT